MARRKPSEFLVNQRREVIEGLFIAIGPLNQQLRDVVGCGHVIENTDQTVGIVHSFDLTALLPQRCKEKNPS
jgi:hypothetical protein